MKKVLLPWDLTRDVYYGIVTEPMPHFFNNISCFYHSLSTFILLSSRTMRKTLIHSDRQAGIGPPAKRHLNGVSLAVPMVVNL